MYPYLGDFEAGKTIFFPFHTFNSSQASVTITGLAVTDIEVYKGASMTQRASDAGYALVDTDGIDLDGITGIHGFTIDTSDNTDAGFYTTASDYTVVVSSITADAQTVNFIAGRFSISNRAGLKPTVEGRTLDVETTGEAGLDFANVAIPDGPVPALGFLEGGTAVSAAATNLVGRAAATNDIVRPGMILTAYGSTQAYWQTVMIDSVSGDTFTIAGWPVTTPTGTITYRVIAVPQQSASLPVPANVVQHLGTACATPTVAGVPEVDVTHVAGATTNVSALATGTAAIKVVTDQMVFTKANELDVNTQSINGATVVGDGNATPWDGA